MLDQAAKAMVLADSTLNALGCRNGLAPCGQHRLSSVFDISMTWNRGVSFGALQSEGLARWILVLAALAIAVVFSLWLIRAERKLTAVSLALVIGGAIGNAIDRVLYGAVIDFLDFSGLSFIWIFNVADASITIGAGLLLLDQMLAGRKPQG